MGLGLGVSAWSFKVESGVVLCLELRVLKNLHVRILKRMRINYKSNKLASTAALRCSDTFRGVFTTNL